MPYPLDEDGEVVETSLRSFIGLANFSRRYVNNFALLTYRLNGLLNKDEQRDLDVGSHHSFRCNQV